MAVTIIFPEPRHTNATESVTGTAYSRYLIGPPKDQTAYNGIAQGRYIRESGSSGSETYRWICDEPLDISNTNPRRTYVYDGV